jgi:hypothetical protein
MAALWRPQDVLVTLGIAPFRLRSASLPSFIRLKDSFRAHVGVSGLDGQPSIWVGNSPTILDIEFSRIASAA